MRLNEIASKGAKWTALSSGLNALIGFAQISVVARYFEPSDFGVIALIFVVHAVANVFVTVGFSDVFVVRHDATVEQLSTMYWLNIFVGLIAYAILFAGAPLLSLVTNSEDIANMVRIMGLTLVMGSIVVQFNALMRRELNLKGIAIITFIAQLVGFVCAVTMVINGFGIWSLIFAAIASQLVSSLMLLNRAARYGWFPRLVFKLDNVIEMIRFGIYRIGAAFLNTINTKIDQLAIGAFLNISALGFYTIAHNLAMQPFSRINPVLTKVSFPVFAKIKNDDARLLRGYRKGLRMIMVVNAPLLIGLIALAPHVIPTLLGPGWEESIPVLQILSLYVLLRSATNINIGLILAKNRYRWPLYWNFFMLFATPLTILIAAYLSRSLIVVSWSLLGLQVFISIMAYLLFARRLLGNFALGYLNDIVRPIVTSVLMATGVLWVQGQFEYTYHWAGLMVLIPLGAVLYLLLSLIIQKQHVKELFNLAKTGV